jgi:uncharacterized SAM-binding protein YcdF (DUF218 family)
MKEMKRVPSDASFISPRAALLPGLKVKGSQGAGGTRRGRWRRARAAAVALLVLWPFAAWAAAEALVVGTSVESADALVVLSGSGAYVERARRAAELYRAGRAPRVLLTDDGQRGPWSEVRQVNPLFVESAREELLRAGVPGERVEVLPGVVAGTYDEAVAVRDYAARSGARSLLFVTSAYHTRRARWALGRAFRGSGVEVGVEASAPGAQTPSPWAWWLSRRGWRAVALEYPKLVYYYWKYR